MSLKKVLNDVLKEIDVENSVVKEMNNVAKRFISGLKKNGLNAFIGGSLAKGTLVKKGSQDIDIFVVFDNKIDSSKIGGALKKLRFNFSVVHGSRDYYHIHIEDFLIELIPVIKVKKLEEVENVTDFSLSHVKYIKDKLKKCKGLASEIKLAKTFCRANNCYGAESYIGGFSGYALEVLVIFYGGFGKFLKNFGKKKTVDPEKYFKNEGEIMRELNKSKLVSPVIVIDPTYKYRNICAGLSDETYEVFNKARLKFLKKPESSFFELKPFEVAGFFKLKRKEDFLVKFNLKTNRQEGDIAASKMKKLFNFILDELKRNQQEVIKKEFVYEEGQVAEGYALIKKKELIDFQGPPTSMKEAVRIFKKHSKKCFIKKGFVWCKKEVSLEQIFGRLQNYDHGIGADFEWEIL
jgi:tRNA CCA-adding enzyme